jgi:hypothetical protein
MTRFRLSLSIGVAALSVILAAVPAEAQNRFSFVSAFTGDNANDCSSPASACQTMTTALTNTIPGGEIRCLDSHLNVGFTITIPVTIDCDAPSSVIRGGGGGPGFPPPVAITVNLDEVSFPNGVVTLRNINLQGLLGSAAPGTKGISVIGGGAAVHVENCSILGFSQQGIDFRPTSSVDLFVRDTIISNNQGGGVWIIPAVAATVRASLSNVRLDQNGSIALAVNKASGGTAAVTVEDTQIERNSIGLRANGVNAFMLLIGSTVTYNTVGLQILSGGRIISSGNNTINLNSANGAPTSTVPLK